MLFADNMQRHLYRVYMCAACMLTPPFCFPLPHPLLHLSTPLFTYLENQLLLLVVRIPIHSCPWFAINCSPLAASPTPGTPQIKLHIYIDDINNISRLIWYTPPLWLNNPYPVIRPHQRDFTSSPLWCCLFLGCYYMSTVILLPLFTFTLFPWWLIHTFLLFIHYFNN
jgi:hypothetical protein